MFSHAENKIQLGKTITKGCKMEELIPQAEVYLFDMDETLINAD